MAIYVSCAIGRRPPFHWNLLRATPHMVHRWFARRPPRLRGPGVPFVPLLLAVVFVSPCGVPPCPPPDTGSPPIARILDLSDDVMSPPLSRSRQWAQAGPLGHSIAWRRVRSHGRSGGGHGQRCRRGAGGHRFDGFAAPGIPAPGCSTGGPTRTGSERRAPPGVLHARARSRTPSAPAGVPPHPLDRGPGVSGVAIL